MRKTAAQPGDFYSPRTDNLHAVYLAEISGEVRAYAVYQPFSQKLYVLEPEEVIYRSGFSAGEYVQFTLGYGSFKCPFSIYTRIRRCSRCFRFEKRWFRREFQLYAREDSWLNAMSFIPDSLWKKVFIWIPKAKT